MAVVRTDTEERPSNDDSALESLLRKAARISREPLSPQLPNVGAIIGQKYRIEARLGRGGMGAVFKATHVVSQKPVALKWMLRSASDEGMRRRFLREARAAGRIDHPNVVDVYDVGQEEDCCYLVMELLHGESLRARLDHGILAIAEAVDLLLPVMRGVMAVHQAGVVHRDLKPDNVFLCAGRDGEPREAKVLDFGISALHESDPDHPTLTADGVLLGTPAYMSPEQLQNAREIDARSDVYSFGVILYETLTGHLPFEADSYASLVLTIVQDAPKDLRQLRPELPPELEQVVLRALAKKRDDRYPSIEALIAAVAPFGSVQSAELPRVMARDQRRSRLRLGLLALGALGAAGALGVVAAQVSGWTLGHRSPETKVTTSPGSQLGAAQQAAGAEPAVAASISAPTPPAVEALQAAPAVDAAKVVSTLDSAAPAAVSGQSPVTRPVTLPVTLQVADPPPAAPEPAAAAPTSKRAPLPGVKRPAVKHADKPAAAERCDPPYSIDAAGRKIFKLECL